MSRRSPEGVDLDRHLRYIAAMGRETSARFAETAAADLARDPDLLHSLARRLQTIGESANHLTDDERGRHREFPFDGLRQMRNGLSHDHLRTDGAVLLDITRTRIPEITAIAGAELTRRRGLDPPGGRPSRDPRPGPSLDL